MAAGKNLHHASDSGDGGPIVIGQFGQSLCQSFLHCWGRCPILLSIASMQGIEAIAQY